MQTEAAAEVDQKMLGELFCRVFAECGLELNSSSQTPTQHTPITPATIARA